MATDISNNPVNKRGAQPAITAKDLSKIKSDSKGSFEEARGATSDDVHRLVTYFC
jgi:hypothetical protein